MEMFFAVTLLNHSKNYALRNSLVSQILVYPFMALKNVGELIWLKKIARWTICFR